MLVLFNSIIKISNMERVNIRKSRISMRESRRSMPKSMNIRERMRSRIRIIKREIIGKSRNSIREIRISERKAGPP